MSSSSEDYKSNLCCGAKGHDKYRYFVPHLVPEPIGASFENIVDQLVHVVLDDGLVNGRFDGVVVENFAVGIFYHSRLGKLVAYVIIGKVSNLIRKSKLNHEILV